jgi:hypothetical protein
MWFIFVPTLRCRRLWISPRYIESICKKIIPVELEGVDGQAMSGGLIDIVNMIISQKEANGLLEVHVMLPRFKAFMKYFYHIYLSPACRITMDVATPLITIPAVWKIMHHCHTEVVAFAADVGNAGRVPKSVFANRLSLLFDVCGPFLTAVSDRHYTSDVLSQANDIAREGSMVLLKRLNREEIEAEFEKIALHLIESVTRILIQGRRQ